jgi:hypothetical protein
MKLPVTGCQIKFSGLIYAGLGCRVTDVASFVAKPGRRFERTTCAPLNRGVVYSGDIHSWASLDYGEAFPMFVCEYVYVCVCMFMCV